MTERVFTYEIDGELTRVPLSKIGEFKEDVEKRGLSERTKPVAMFDLDGEPTHVRAEHVDAFMKEHPKSEMIIMMSSGEDNVFALHRRDRDAYINSIEDENERANIARQIMPSSEYAKPTKSEMWDAMKRGFWEGMGDSPVVQFPKHVAKSAVSTLAKMPGEITWGLKGVRDELWAETYDESASYGEGYTEIRELGVMPKEKKFIDEIKSRHPDFANIGQWRKASPEEIDKLKEAGFELEYRTHRGRVQTMREENKYGTASWTEEEIAKETRRIEKLRAKADKHKASSRTAFENEKIVQEVMTPKWTEISPYDTSVAAHYGQVAGSGLGSLALAASFGPTMGALVLSEMEARGQYDEARAAGLSPSEAFEPAAKAFIWNYVSEKLPLDLMKSTKGGLSGAITGTIAETIQEVTQEVGSNKIAKDHYDPERKWYAGTGDAAFGGGFSGGVVGGTQGSLNVRRASKPIDSVLIDFGADPNDLNKLSFDERRRIREALVLGVNQEAGHKIVKTEASRELYDKIQQRSGFDFRKESQGIESEFNPPMTTDADGKPTMQWTFSEGGVRQAIDPKTGIMIQENADGTIEVFNKNRNQHLKVKNAQSAIEIAHQISIFNQTVQKIRNQKLDYLQDVAGRLAGNIEFQAFETVDDFIASHPDVASHQDFSRNIGGVRLENGTVAIILDNVGSPYEMLKTVMHEGGIHGGLREMFQDEGARNEFLKQIDARAIMRGLDVAIRQGYDPKSAVGIEEALAYLYDSRTENPSRYQRAVFAIHDAMRKVFPNMKFTKSDVDVMVSRMQHSVRGDAGFVENMSGVGDTTGQRVELAVNKGFINQDVVEKANSLKADGFKISVQDFVAMSSEQQAEFSKKVDEQFLKENNPSEEISRTPVKRTTPNRDERRAALIDGMNAPNETRPVSVNTTQRSTAETTDGDTQQEVTKQAQPETSDEVTAKEEIQDLESSMRLKERYPQEYQEALEAVDGNEEYAIGLLREQTEAREKARRFRESREAIAEKLDNNEQLTAGDVRILASEDVLGPDLYNAGYRLDKSTGNWNHMNSDQAPNKYNKTAPITKQAEQQIEVEIEQAESEAVEQDNQAETLGVVDDVETKPVQEGIKLDDILYGQREVTQVPVDEINVQLPGYEQFKQDADPETGEVAGQELIGDIVDLDAKPIIVLQLNDGRKVVVTGRHRLALYKRNGIKTIPARVIYESEGVTPDISRAIDAISNILDEKGTISDYIKFFRETGISEERAKPLLSRPSARTAYSIYKDSSPVTQGAIDWDGTDPNGISPEQAGVISHYAPMSESKAFGGAQAMGVRAAKRGMKPRALGGYMQALVRNARIQAEQAAGPQMGQMDLFSGTEWDTGDADSIASKEGVYTQEKAKEFTRLRSVLSNAVNKPDSLVLTPQQAKELGITDKTDKKQLRDAWSEADRKARYWGRGLLELEDMIAMRKDLGLSTEGLDGKPVPAAPAEPSLFEKPQEKPVEKPKPPKLHAPVKAPEPKVVAPVKTVEKPTPRKIGPKESTNSHTAIYNGKEVKVDSFKQAAMRVSDNLKTGEHGYVKSPDGKLYEIVKDKKTATLVPEMRTKEARQIAELESQISKAKSNNERAVLTKRLEDMKAEQNANPVVDAVANEKAKEQSAKPAPRKIGPKVVTQKATDTAENKQKPIIKSPIENLSQEDRAELKALQDQIRAISKRLNIGIDPDLLIAGTKMASLYIKGGTKTFSQFASAVKHDMSDVWGKIKNHLRTIWEGASNDHPNIEEVSRAEGKRIISEIDSQAIKDSKITTVDQISTETYGDKALKAAERVAEAIRGSKKLTRQDVSRIVGEVFGGTEAAGVYSSKDVTDILELAVNMLLNDMGTAADPTVATAAEARARIQNIKAQGEAIPTQTTRTEEMVKLQQFSTPPHLAYLANWVANIQQGETVLEPSAGIGGLAVFANNAGANVVLNELSERRAEILSKLGLSDKVYTENAENLFAIFEPKIVSGEIRRPTVVVMNPPFSNSATTTHSSTMIGAKHVEQALEILSPGGRLVAIVGNGMDNSKPSFKAWWKKIGRDYTVRANVGIDGSEYRKYGTSFDNNIIVIDKIKPSGQVQTVYNNVKAVEELPSILQEVRNERNTTQQQHIEPSSQKAAIKDEGGRLPGPAVSNPIGNRPSIKRNKGRLGQSGTVGTGGVATDTRKVGRDDGGVRPGDGLGSTPATKGVSGDGTPVVGSKSVSATPELQLAKGADSLNGRRVISDGTFSEYSPQKVNYPGATKHPSPLVESSAMASVDPPDPTYKPKIAQSLIESGALSDAQLEVVTYAGQSFEQVMPNGSRMGFFIGDGTGVGKGREIAGIILDQWNRGNKKAVWVSKNIGLLADAKRDLSLFGLDGELIDMSKNGGAALNKAKKGIPFVSYDSLRQGHDGLNSETGELRTRFVKGKEIRLSLLEKFLGKDFDGVIALDECHEAGNAVDQRGTRGTKRASKRALAVIDLQRMFPNARILYVSATGATEVSNLSFGDRLGIWGDGTSFSSKQDFIDQISSGGLSAMEIVARDLKAAGRYMARTLSYEGIENNKLVHKVTPEQKRKYNEICKAWQEVLQSVGDSLIQTGGANSSRAKAAAMQSFFGAQQRFFNQILTALQMPSIIADAKAALARGESVVFQLTNTNEATQERAISKAKAEDSDFSADDLDLSPRDILMQYILTSYPVAQYQAVQDEDGNIRHVIAKDSDGNIIEDPRAVAKRSEMLQRIGAMTMSENPMEMILNEFGADNVAEVTGRSRRVVERMNDQGINERIVESRAFANRSKEAAEFNDGKRRILVFSAAGGTGFSYHADKNFSNQQLRNHYLVQAGWRADTAIQGFGRTHRSNEAQPPRYILASTDIKGHQRFISTIARRLNQLGSLTSGDRSAAGGGTFTETDNLETSYSKDALDRVIRGLHDGSIRSDGLDFTSLMRDLGFMSKSRNERTGEIVETNKLLDPETGGLDSEKFPTIPQFLNRILALDYATQNELFDTFFNVMGERIEAAKQNGTYDQGLQTLDAEEVRITDKATLFEKQGTSEKTELVTVDVDRAVRRLDWDTLQKRTADKDVRLVRNIRSGKLYAIVDSAVTRTNNRGEILETYIRFSPAGTREVIDRQHVKFNESDPTQNNYDLVTTDPQSAWNEAYEQTPTIHTTQENYMAGTMLPVWNRINMNSPMIYRISPKDGNTFLGVFVPKSQLKGLRGRFGIASDGSVAAKLSPQQILADVLAGGQFELANGWRLKRSRVGGENRIEVTGLETSSQLREFRNYIGGFTETIQYVERAFMPDGDADAMKRLLDKAPIAVDTAADNASVSEADDGIRFRKADQNPMDAMPEEYSGIVRTTNDYIEARRRAVSLDPMVRSAALTEKDAYNAAKTTYEMDPSYAAHIVHSIIQSPRTLTPEERMLVLMENAAINFEYDSAIAAGEEALKSGDQQAIAESIILKDRALDVMKKMDRAVKIANRESGRSLRFIQATLKEDFSLTSMKRRLLAAQNFEPLSDAQNKFVEAKFKQLQEINKKLTDRLAELDGKGSRDGAKRVLGKILFERKVANPDAMLARTLDTARKHIEANDGVMSAIDIERLIRRLAKIHVSLGAKTVNSLVDGITGSLHEIMPGQEFSERYIQDAISSYGKVTYPNPEQDAATLRDLRQQMMKLSAIEDVLNELAPKKTGPQRDAPSAEVRALTKKLHALMKEMNISTRSKESQLKSSLDSIKTRLENQIEDMERAIRLGQPMDESNKAPVAYDDETMSLKARRDALKLVYDDIFVTGNSDAAKLARAIARSEETLAKWEKKAGKAGEGIFDKSKEKKVYPPEVQAIRDQIKALQKEYAQLKDLQNPKLSPEEIAAKNYRRGLETSIKHWQERLDNKDFGPRPKPQQRVLDKEMFELNQKRELIKAQVMKEEQRYRLANRSAVVKAWDMLSTPTNWLRAFRSSFDNSAILRQGGLFVASHPIIMARNLVKSFKAIGKIGKLGIGQGGEYETARIDEAMRNDPMFKYFLDAGVYVAPISESAALTDQEEAFRGHFRTVIGEDPVAREYGILSDIYNVGSAGMTVVNMGIRSSERAYITVLNQARFDVFKAMVASTPQGNASALSDVELKAIGSYINIASGRGEYGVTMTQASDALSTLLWSPRNLMARAQFIVGRPLWGGSKLTRKLIAREYAKVALGTLAKIGLMSMFAAMWRDDDDDYPIVELNSASSDFLKVRMGRTRVDLMSGISQVTVFATRMITGKTKTGRGDIVNLSEQFGNSYEQVAGRFLRSKLSPTIGIFTDIAYRNTYDGKKITLSKDPDEGEMRLHEYAIKSTMPLSILDVRDAGEEFGLTGTFTLGVLSLLGAGIQTYDAPNYKRAMSEFRYRVKQFNAAETAEDRVKVKAKAPYLKRKDAINATARQIKNLEDKKKKMREEGKDVSDINEMIGIKQKRVLNWITGLDESAK